MGAVALEVHGELTPARRHGKVDVLCRVAPLSVVFNQPESGQWTYSPHLQPTQP